MAPRRTTVLIAAAAALCPLACTHAQDDPTEAEETYTLPAPTGGHRVGVTTWHVIDPSRPDAYGATPSAVREMMVHAWYPAQVGDDAEAAPYRPLARNDHDMVKKHAVAGAPFDPAAAPAPVVLVCPGRGTLAEYNTSLAEDLASHGYAVFAVDSLHTGRVAFPDGRVVPPLAKFRPSGELMTGPYQHVDAFFEEAVDIAAGDVDFVLERLEELNAADPAGRFTGALDLSRIGIYGHSLGGRICGDVAGRNDDVLAFAAMEAVPPREVRRSGAIGAAIMMMYSSELPEDIALPNIKEVIPNRRSDVFLARFEGLGHNSSTDLPLIAEPRGMGYQVEPEEGLRLMREAILDFFDAYVRNGAFPSDRVAAEPRIRIETFAAPPGADD